ncbi:hypothetical protein KIN20_023997 [Parelaphostrongylus tenuis]|uniref:Uncharacterized protein n=1 Tax=Parelaphostrongylus tenuis TaxID=148309 RepID=A0AAD5QW38_PARTN|nr:hypothetical protein KIN20_023997 [Parelaphostrongylus tenuis]
MAENGLNNHYASNQLSIQISFSVNLSFPSGFLSRRDAFCHVSEIWVDTTTTSRNLRSIHRAFERSLLSVNRFSRRLGGMEQYLRKLSHFRDPEI